MEIQSGNQPLTREDLVAWTLTLLVLAGILLLHLLPALLAALLVYELISLLAPRLGVTRLGSNARAVLAVTLLAGLLIAALVGVGLGVASFLRHSDESIPALLQRMAQIIDNSRAQLPDWILARLPEDADELRLAVVTWLRAHSELLQGAGTEAGRMLAHGLIGLIIGVILVLQGTLSRDYEAPLAQGIARRARGIGDAFRRVVFAQFTIALINSLLTALYLVVVLPLFGVHLPLGRTLILVTFGCGLIPIVGNLISNSVIFVVSLSSSLLVAVGSLTYLVLVHKLEYFLNARVVGSHIRASAWELLTAMLVMEAAFGLAGLVAAPIYYAFFKDQLRQRGWI